jgi:N-methylhydantoinase A
MTKTRTRIGADVGGTFTDVILQRADGQLSFRKLLSTPPSYDQAVVAATRELALSENGRPRIDEIVNGTTVATNAVIERRGSRTALVTTAGFRDVLELRRLRIPFMYDLFWRKPPSLIERELRFELSERVAADGTVLKPLEEEEARAVCAQLRAAGVEAVAVCFLHSYLYPRHEERFAEILREELSSASISISSEILREQGEYERTATTAVNAYVRPLMAHYVERLRTGLAGVGVEAPLMIMQSSGGVMTDEDATTRPVFALESGPAAGVVASLWLAQRLGRPNVIAFDMGGTTAKTSLIEEGQISRAREYEVGGALSAGSRLLRGSGELLRIPSIDIAEVGAGGGSIAWLDEAGGLQIGPKSAGADPGPACYGRGSSEPTVTDANVVLGYIPSRPIADGQVSISAELAAAAVDGLSERLGLSLIETAYGIHQLANARMMRALRAVSSEKGRDPREFALLAYGGSGPVHAAGLAEDLGVNTILVPAIAGFFSAVGLLCARPEFHDVRPCYLDTREVELSQIRALYREMQESLASLLAGVGAISWLRTADLRYLGQSWEIEVWFADGKLDAHSLADLVERFEDEHERVYGVRGEPGAVEIRALRLAGLGPAPPADTLSAQAAAISHEGSSRVAYLGGEEEEIEIRTRASIGSKAVEGPLLIDEYDTTIVVPPAWTVSRDSQTQTLILTRRQRP